MVSGPVGIGKQPQTTKRGTALRWCALSSYPCNLYINILTSADGRPTCRKRHAASDQSVALLLGGDVHSPLSHVIYKYTHFCRW